MEHISKRAQIDARNKNANNMDKSEASISRKVSEENSSVLEEFDLLRMSSDESDRVGNSVDLANEDKINVENQCEESSSSKFAVGKGFAARVIDLNAVAGCASMHVPGVGVKQFHFSNLFDGISTQSIVYSSCASDSIVAALNGFNSCILCYGQTGKYKDCIDFLIYDLKLCYFLIFFSLSRVV